MEAEAFLAAMKDLKLPDGRDRVVRHGHGPEHTIQTGIGPVEGQRSEEVGIKVPRLTATGSGFPRRSCRNGLGGRKVWMHCYQCFICAAYQRATSRKRWRRFWARRRRTLSAAVISRLTGEWKDEYDHWQKRDLAARRYVYVWADGVYLQARMEDNAECMLVLIGATPEGRRELVGFQVGAWPRARKAGVSSWSR